MPREAQFAENHTVDPQTGFLESTAYPSAFDAQRKQLFLQVFKSNGLGLYRTCQKLGLAHNTVTKHYHNDPAFKKAYDDAMTEYADELEAVSRENALNPRSVIERIFQLKALVPGKYNDQRIQSHVEVSINVDGELLKMVRERERVIDVKEVELSTENSQLVDGK